MNASEERVIRNVIKRLKGEGGSSPEIKAMLADERMRIWLDTWVVGALQHLLPESRDLRLAVDLSS